jgi:hypothetical protein
MGGARVTEFETWLETGIKARHPEWFIVEAEPARVSARRALDRKSAAAGEAADTKNDRRSI